MRTEQVPLARPSARHGRDFEDVAAWLAQRMDKTSVALLLRCSWKAVDHIADRVVVEHIDDTRLDGLLRIGVDEVSYKRGHRYLTIVADHDSGRVVWVGRERTKQSFEAFVDALGPTRAGQVEAISLDGSSIHVFQWSWSVRASGGRAAAWPNLRYRWSAGGGGGSTPTGITTSASLALMGAALCGWSAGLEAQSWVIVQPEAPIAHLLTDIGCIA